MRKMTLKKMAGSLQNSWFLMALLILPPIWAYKIAYDSSIAFIQEYREPSKFFSCWAWDASLIASFLLIIYFFFWKKFKNQEYLPKLWFCGAIALIVWATFFFGNPLIFFTVILPLIPAVLFYVFLTFPSILFYSSGIGMFFLIKKYWKQWMWIPFAAVLIPVEILNFSGFCYSDLRWHSKRELVDAFLFGPEGHTMTEAQKIARLKKEKHGIYPDCCRINDRFLEYSHLENFIQAILGDPLYEIEINIPDMPPIEDEHPYRATYYAIDKCGNGGEDYYGERIEKVYYKMRLERNKQYWNGERK